MEQITWQTDPWAILRDGLSIGTIAADDKSTELMKSGYALLRTIGLVGCAVTMIVIIIKFSSGNPNSRAEAKSMFSKKVVLIFFIFTAAYFFGYILGILNNL